MTKKMFGLKLYYYAVVCLAIQLRVMLMFTHNKEFPLPSLAVTFPTYFPWNE